MRIGLVDVDGHNFPNIALMKLSAWHKRRGDTVEFADPAVRRYDKVYMSKVFTFSRDCTAHYDCEVVRAGTGYSLLEWHASQWCFRLPCPRCP